MYTNAVIENEIWGSLETNFKVYIDNTLATIPKIVFTYYNFYLDKVHLIHLIHFKVEREREKESEGLFRPITYPRPLSRSLVNSLR